MESIFLTKAEGQVLKQDLSNEVKSGIKETATQTNAPTAYTPEAYPNGLFETYVVRKPLTLPNSWGSEVTQAELDANFVFFDIKNGVVSKELKPSNISDVNKADLVTGKNKFNKDTAVIGSYLTETNIAGVYEVYDYSDFIPVVELQQYKSNFDFRYVCYFDANKNYVAGGIGETDSTFTPPVGVKFIKVTIWHTDINLFQLELGNVSTTFESYKNTVPAKNLDLTNYLEKSNLISQLSTSELLISGKNKFDKSTVVLGSFLGENNVPEVRVIYDYSDFIPVVELASYISNYPMRFTTYFDANKNYVAGGSGIELSRFTVPVGVKFIRITIRHTDLNLFQLEQGNISTIYMPFRKVINPNNLEIYADQINSSNINVILPSEIYLTETLESNIYFDNAVIPEYGDNLNNYRVKINSEKGAQFDRFWRYTPLVGEAGIDTLDLIVNLKRTPIIQKRTKLKIASKSAGTGITRKVLLIGDSTVDGEDINMPMKAFFDTDNMNVEFVGTRGTAGNLHEGRAGWTLNDYTTATDGTWLNPFFNPATSLFDFQYYLTNTGQDMGIYDWVFFQLGINDMFTQTDLEAAEIKANVMIGQLNSFIESVRTTKPGIRVGVCLTIPPAKSQDAFGDDYKNGFLTELYTKTGLLTWNKKLISVLDIADNKTAQIFLVPMNLNIDTVNNFPRANVPVNSRNEATESRQIDSVHPDYSGYSQMADSYIGIIKYFG